MFFIRLYGGGKSQRSSVEGTKEEPNPEMSSTKKSTEDEEPHVTEGVPEPQVSPDKTDALDKKKVVMYVVAVLIILGVGYYLYRRRFSKKDAPSSSSEVTPMTQTHEQQQHEPDAVALPNDVQDVKNRARQLYSA